jgi:flagellar basal-body rod protein FlgG
MDAQQLKMDVIANNIANASTTGFKKGRPEFEDLLSETIRAAAAPDPQGGSQPSAVQVGLGVKTGATTQSFSQGDMLNTGNPLDVAIGGDGFFRVQKANGDLAYTRAGNFKIDAAGRLTTVHGELIEPGVNVPPEAQQVTIAADGTVTATIPGRTDPQQLGQIELTNFQNPAGLSALGSNLFAATPASGEPINAKPGENNMGTLSQGFLEGANVKAVEEMIDMISTQRAYELNSNVIKTADQMLQRVTNIR